MNLLIDIEKKFEHLIKSFQNEKYYKIYNICKKRKTFDFNESLCNLFFFFITSIFLGNSFYNSVNRVLKMKHFEYIHNVSSKFFFYLFNKTLQLKYYTSTFFLFKKSQFEGGKICRIMFDFQCPPSQYCKKKIAKQNCHTKFKRILKL